MLTYILLDEPVFSPEEEATINVDALVNDADVEPVRMATPSIPPGLEQPRGATPTIPPGFSAPMAHRPVSAHANPPMSRTASSTVPPVVPVVPVTPIRAATPQRPDRADVTIANAVQPVAGIKSKPSTPVKGGRQATSAKPQPTAPAIKGEPESQQTTTESPTKSTFKGKAATKKVVKQ
jgi:hypothetical protein